MVQSANGRMVEEVFKISKFEFELMRQNDRSARDPPDDSRLQLFNLEDAFRVYGDDIQRIRTEIKTRIEKLLIVYATVKNADKQAKERAKEGAAQITR